MVYHFALYIKLNIYGKSQIFLVGLALLIEFMRIHGLVRDGLANHNIITTMFC